MYLNKFICLLAILRLLGIPKRQVVPRLLMVLYQILS